MSESKSQNLFFDFSNFCHLTSCNIYIYILTSIIFGCILVSLILALIIRRKNKKATHSLFHIEIKSLPFDRVKEFIENINNKDYFPGEVVNIKYKEKKENIVNERNVVINQPIIVREKFFIQNEEKIQIISVRDLPKK